MDSSTTKFNGLVKELPHEQIDFYCIPHLNKSEGINENYTIESDILYKNYSELNHLEQYLKVLFENRIADSQTEIIIYSIMLFFGFIGNIFVIIRLFTGDRRSSRRENVLFLHLSTVDILIVFSIVPAEIYWKKKFVWDSGLLLCRAFHFFKNYFM